MYKFRVIKQVHSNFSTVSTSDTYLYREVELPFPPYKGLVLLLGKDEVVVELCEVYFDPVKREFKVYAEEDRELYDLRHKPDARPVAAIVEEYLDAGWKIRR